MKEFKLLINGRLVPGAMTMDVINPATEEVLTKCPRADADQLEEAVQAAKAAFPAWAATPWAERAKMMVQLADAFAARREEFARLLTEEQGKPLEDARDELGGTEGFFRYFASLELPDRLIEDSETRRIVEHRTPLGVVGAIMPWNFPLLLLAIKLGPGLMAGNTMVAKPAPTTPLTTLLLGELCADIFPPGVINIIADQNDLGGLISRHPDIAKVAFTGSTATGKKVMESAASSLKRLTLELGGNDAAIVLDDVDPKAMAPKIFAGATHNCGQICIAIKRLYVHDSMYDTMCDELAKLANDAVIDDGMKQGTQIGPIQNKAQFEKVKGFLEDAHKSGTVIAGGEIPDRPGYFIRPTIVRDISDDAYLVKEEQFSPILPVLRYSDIDDAVARANDTPWGLGGSVWSSDIDRAYDVALRIDSGTVWVNKHVEPLPGVPFGGSKQSGIGVELNEESLAEYTQRHVINIAK